MANLQGKPLNKTIAIWAKDDIYLTYVFPLGITGNKSFKTIAQ